MPRCVARLQVAPGEHLAEGPETGDSSKALPTGRVVGIVKRSWRSRGYCGSLQPSARVTASAAGAARLLFVPVERRFPKIRIATRQGASLMDKRLVVAIDEWDATSAYPSGHYVRTLGTIGDRETETEARAGPGSALASPFASFLLSPAARFERGSAASLWAGDATLIASGRSAGSHN